MKHYIAVEDLLEMEPFNKPCRVGYFDESYRQCANDIRRIIESKIGASAAPSKDTLYWGKGQIVGVRAGFVQNALHMHSKRHRVARSVVIG